MRIDLRTTLFVAAVALPANVLTAYAVSNVASDSLASVDSFSSISDPAARSAAYFTELGKVLTSPRCLNCHPAGDRPRQGDTARLHQPPVERAPTASAFRPCDVPFAIRQRTSSPGGCRATLSGILRRARWLGKARRSARSALRSRIPRVTATARWRASLNISARTIWSAGRGRPGPAGNQRQARSSKRARSLRLG